MSALLKCLLLLYATATATVVSIPGPQLNGEHFRITVVQEGSFLDVMEAEDGSLEFGGYLIDMIKALASENRANFTFELRTPSGLGSDCEPQLQSEQDDDLYSAKYRQQYKCGTNDVNELSGKFSTQLYLGMFYISPERQLLNDFTIPFVP
jgi:hypothetical protein